MPSHLTLTVGVEKKYEKKYILKLRWYNVGIGFEVKACAPLAACIPSTVNGPRRWRF